MATDPTIPTRETRVFPNKFRVRPETMDAFLRAQQSRLHAPPEGGAAESKGGEPEEEGEQSSGEASGSAAVAQGASSGEPSVAEMRALRMSYGALRATRKNPCVNKTWWGTNKKPIASTPRKRPCCVAFVLRTGARRRQSDSCDS